MKGVKYFADRILLGSSEVRSLAQAVGDGNHFFYKEVPKRRGGKRRLCLPDGTLGPVLKKSLEFFYAEKWPLPDIAFGFIPKRSAVGHARNHLAKPEVLHVDLQDFFAHVTQEQVGAGLSQFGFDTECTNVMTKLFTVDGSLPQGFPTSPYLSNMVFIDADRELIDAAAAFDLTYSRYADDLVFSGVQTLEALKTITSIVESRGWPVNRTKTRVEKRGQKQYVAGLTVFDSTRPRLSRRLKRAYRLKAYLIEKYGYDHYLLHLGGEERNDTPRRLKGMARYMASVEPGFGGPLRKSLEDNIDEEFMPRGQWDEQDLDAIYDW